MHKPLVGVPSANGRFWVHLAAARGPPVRAHGLVDRSRVSTDLTRNLTDDDLLDGGSMGAASIAVDVISVPWTPSPRPLAPPTVWPQEESSRP